MSRYDVDKLIAGIQKKDKVQFAMAITLVESELALHQKLAKDLFLKLGQLKSTSKKIGITGTPGVGKSTFISAIAGSLSASKNTIAILAIDPSSVRSGGSILGDKTRMANLIMDENIYIRPSASGNHLGGVASKTRDVISLCEFFGFDYIFVESVGVGQSEIALSKMVDCFLMLAQPGAGDELQGIKRGILEVIDMVAINKADGDTLNSAKLAKVQIENALHILRGQEEKIPQTFLCSSLNNIGITEIIQGIDQFLQENNIDEKRLRQVHDWFQESLEAQIMTKIKMNPVIAQKLKPTTKIHANEVAELVEKIINSISIDLK